MNKKLRYILFLLIWAFSIFCVCSLPAKAESRNTTIDVMYMIDVSGSIIGLPKGAGNEDILHPLLEALKREIWNTRTGTRVFVMTFAEGLHDVDGSSSRYNPLWQKGIGEETERGDKEEIIRYVMGLNQAVRTETGHGWQTAIYDSMKISLEKLDEVREEYDRSHKDRYSDSHIQKIILFTDGKDTVSKEWDLERFLKEFELRKAEDKMGDNIFIKYVRLPGAFLTEEQKEKFEKAGVHVTEVVNPQEYHPTDVTISPSLLNFGDLKAKPLEERSIQCSFSAQTTIPKTAISVESLFDNLPAGVELIVEATPNKIEEPTPNFLFKLIPQLSNIEAMNEHIKRTGIVSYHGYVRLKPTNLDITFLNPKLEASFNYGEPPPPTIEYTKPKRLGKGESQQITITLKRNRLYQPKDYLVEVKPEKGYERLLSISLVGEKGTLIPKDDHTATASVTVTVKALEGLPWFSSCKLRVSVDDPEEIIIPLRAPIPWYVWLIIGIVVVVLAWIIRCLFLVPKFDENVYIVIDRANEIRLKPKQRFCSSSLVIGSAGDIRIEGANPKHAKLVARRGGGCNLIPLRGSEMSLSGLPVEKRMSLYDGASIEIGNHTIEYREGR